MFCQKPLQDNAKLQETHGTSNECLICTLNFVPNGWGAYKTYFCSKFKFNVQNPSSFQADFLKRQGTLEKRLVHTLRIHHLAIQQLMTHG